MPTADFFVPLGVFVTHDFFTPELCAQIRGALTLAKGRPAELVRRGTSRVDTNVRRTQRLPLPEQYSSLLKTRVLALKPQLQDYFQVQLSRLQPLDALVYQPGDFFQPHKDGGHHAADPSYVQQRQLTVIIFLNSQTTTPQPDAYCGGALALYGLVDDPRCQTYGFHLIGESGLLIAFRSEVFHEVQPVTFGQRYTIVSWFG